MVYEFKRNSVANASGYEMEKDYTREVFAWFFSLLNKISSNKGGDSNKGNTEQIQFSRQNSISVFYNAVYNAVQWEYTVRSDQLPELHEVHSR